MSETTISRREMIATVGLCAGAALLPSRSAHAAPIKSGIDATFTTKDGTKLYYNDWGEGRPVVFSHGWPPNSAAWKDQMRFLAARGYLCIAHCSTHKDRVDVDLIRFLTDGSSPD